MPKKKKLTLEKKMILASGLTQRWICGKLGVGDADLSRWINGVRPWPPEQHAAFLKLVKRRVPA